MRMGCFVRVSKLVVVISVLVMMRCEGGMDHVVGGDQGWDAASDIASWSLNKIFTVGDNVWFTYSAAREGVLLEVRSKDEFESCDVSNPIKMFTGGLDAVALDAVGSRYFIGGRSEDCHNGLKLHVRVLPVSNEGDHRTTVADVVADGPTEPSGSEHLMMFMSSLVFIGLVVICFVEF